MQPMSASQALQPKRAAVLAYLMVARPGPLHRRDSLLAMFWPELHSRPLWHEGGPGDGVEAGVANLEDDRSPKQP
jgi:hypothetical protein